MTADGGDRLLGSPRFDVVLRGYDRRQVDEHLARLQRVIARLRADLESARSQQAPPPPITPGRGLSGGRPQPGTAAWPASQRPPGPDVVGGFTDRMQSILRAAEEEAAEIRRHAQASAQGDDRLRVQVADLVGQRDAMMAELHRMRGQLAGRAGEPTPPLDQPGARPAMGAADGPRPAPDEPGSGSSAPGAATPPPIRPRPRPSPSPRPAGSPPTAGSAPPPPGYVQPPTSVDDETAAHSLPPRPAAADAGLPQRVPSRGFRPNDDESDEAGPAPGSLFRPRPGHSSVPPSVPQQGGEVERTVAVQAVRPAIPESSDDHGATPLLDEQADAGAAEATTQVDAVSAANESAAEDTVVARVVRPVAEEHDEAADEHEDTSDRHEPEEHSSTNGHGYGGSGRSPSAFHTG